MQKYAIVDFIDDNVLDEFKASEWPLHITLLANFTLVEPVEVFISQLETYAGQLEPFSAETEGEAMFGPNKNVAVSLIRLNNELREIHEGLRRIAESLGAQFDESKFMGDGFRPHATIQVKSRLVEGQTVIVGSFTLVDMFPDKDISKRRVIRKFELGRK